MPVCVSLWEWLCESLLYCVSGSVSVCGSVSVSLFVWVYLLGEFHERWIIGACGFLNKRGYFWLSTLFRSASGGRRWRFIPSFTLSSSTEIQVWSKSKHKMARFACLLLLLIIGVDGVPRDHNVPDYRPEFHMRHTYIVNDVGSPKNVSTTLFVLLTTWLLTLQPEIWAKNSP